MVCIELKGQRKRKTNVLPFSAAGIIRPFMIFVTEETYIGQLFDVYIYRTRLKDTDSLDFVVLF